MIRCIVFDFDGTLVVSNHIKLEVFYQVTHPYDPNGSTVTRILKQYPNKDRYGIFLEIVRELLVKKQISKQESPKSLATQWAEDYTLSCEQAIATCKEVPGTTETLRWISQQNIPIFINSRTPTPTLNRLVTLRSFDRYASKIYGAPATKTENLWNIQNLSQAPFQEILFVGDSEDDRKAALEVGCHFVGVIIGEENRFTHPPPEIQISDLYQLQPIVRTLHEKNTQIVNSN
jgi:phosphoglycolate phosphatase-like HAD superfamily hydrolase